MLKAINLIIQFMKPLRSYADYSFEVIFYNVELTIEEGKIQQNYYPLFCTDKGEYYTNDIYKVVISYVCCCFEIIIC